MKLKHRVVGAVYLAATERDATIESPKHLLVTVLAWVRHSWRSHALSVAATKPPLISGGRIMSGLLWDIDNGLTEEEDNEKNHINVSDFSSAG